MRSRLGIAILLAAGALFSTSGTALGVSALSTELTAGAAQYGQEAPAAPPAGGQVGAPPAGGQVGGPPAGGQVGGPPPGGQVLGVSENSPPGEEAGGGGEGAVAGESAESAPGAAQAGRQTQALGDRLPFTGYAAIPLLLMGIALLASGLVLRRRAHGAPAQL
ncbi:MAG TPA: hypothetical protein VGR11_16915 [Solirubrobacteraceae bacterium]|nr:hypothetical protein [Solirubrobacteraceae bacterium]